MPAEHFLFLLKFLICFAKNWDYCMQWVGSPHLLKRDDLAAYLEVNKCKCLNISQLFQTIFAFSFEHYIEWISKIADCKNILYRCHTFWGILCRMLLIWNPRCATKSSLFQWVHRFESCTKQNAYLRDVNLYCLIGSGFPSKSSNSSRFHSSLFTQHVAAIN